MLTILAQVATNAVPVIPSMSLSNEAWAAINSIAVAVTAVMTWWAHRKGMTASAANTAAIQAVHAVAVDPAPNPVTVAAAQKAVEALPKVP